MSSQAGISACRSVSSAPAGITPSSPLPNEGELALAVPAVGEPALVPVDPLGGHVMGGVGHAGGEVHEERLVGHQRLLRPHPVDGVVGQVLGEVVALLWGLGRLTGVVPSYSAGYHWLSSPPMKP